MAAALASFSAAWYSRSALMIFARRSRSASAWRATPLEWPEQWFERRQLGSGEMGLTGACSNQEIRLMLADANRVRADLVALPGGRGPTMKVARRRELATTAIVEVLRSSVVPLTIGDVLRRVEQTLGRSVNPASLKAALSEMASSQKSPVRRVSRGHYDSPSLTDA
jgi:hypothetical protein